MGLSELCIRRPVFTTLVTATFIVFGVFAYRLLGVAALPAVDFPTISIIAQLQGASAETMAASVAAPIERQISNIAGITSITSASSLSRTNIVIQFDLNRNIDGAALDVQSALTTAQRRLPIEMTTPPSFRKVNPGDFPVLAISVNSPICTLYGPRQNVTLLATSAMRQAEEYKKVVVAWRNGAPVKLEEIANVVDSVENTRVASWLNENRSVVLAVYRQPSANAVAVVDTVRDKLPSYHAQVPAAINLSVLNDRSISVRESVEDVQFTLLIAIGLVVLVIFLFLRSLSATVIPALAVPVSLIGTASAGM